MALDEVGAPLAEVRAMLREIRAMVFAKSYTQIKNPYGCFPVPGAGCCSRIGLG